MKTKPLLALAALGALLSAGFASAGVPSGPQGVDATWLLEDGRFLQARPGEASAGGSSARADVTQDTQGAMLIAQLDRDRSRTEQPAVYGRIRKATRYQGPSHLTNPPAPAQ